MNSDMYSPILEEFVDRVAAGSPIALIMATQIAAENDDFKLEDNTLDIQQIEDKWKTMTPGEKMKRFTEARNSKYVGENYIVYEQFEDVKIYLKHSYVLNAYVQSMEPDQMNDGRRDERRGGFSPYHRAKQA